MKAKSDTLFKIKKTANELLPDSKVLIFGSRARGDNNNESDYDILIITESEQPMKSKFLLKTKIRKPLLKYGIFSDILIQSNKEINVKKELPGHIIRTIIKEGLIL